MKRITENEAKQWLQDNTDIELIQYNGISSSNKSLFRCICGHEWFTALNTIKNKFRAHNSKKCSKCEIQNAADKKSVTYKQAIIFLQDRDIEIISYSGASSKKSIFRCKKDNFQWTTSLAHIRNSSSGCPKCKKVGRLTIEEVSNTCSKQNIKLLQYAGNTNNKSTFECLQCGHIWETAFRNICYHQSQCPRCVNRSGYLYLYNNILFDSSWELVFYLYHITIGSNIIRLERTKYFFYQYKGKQYKWYPDFVINDIYYEIKPDEGNWQQKDTKDKCHAKRIFHPQVIWVGNKEIRKMQKIVGSVLQYRYKVK